MNVRDASYRLLFHGLIVFLLGLFTGLAMVSGMEIFKNPRLALSGHLVGVSTGMFLLLLGLVVERVTMPARALSITCWCALYGAYGNWGATVFGAFFGTRALTAIAGAGHQGLPWQESTVTFVLATSGTATIVACVLILIGLRKPAQAQHVEG